VGQFLNLPPIILHGGRSTLHLQAPANVDCDEELASQSSGDWWSDMIDAARAGSDLVVQVSAAEPEMVPVAAAEPPVAAVAGVGDMCGCCGGFGCTCLCFGA
jgi:hypothetical protein